MFMEQHIAKAVEEALVEILDLVGSAYQKDVKPILENLLKKQGSLISLNTAYYRSIADSHGECACNTNPDTTDGPEEFCPMHGRRYNELVEMLREAQDKVAEVQKVAEIMKDQPGLLSHASAGTKFLQILYPPKYAKGGAVLSKGSVYFIDSDGNEKHVPSSGYVSLNLGAPTPSAYPFPKVVVGDDLDF